MERLVKGDIIILPFPYSNLSYSKKRPALVIATIDNINIIACQITSQIRQDGFSIEISDSDFEQGQLKKISYARPGLLFTAACSIVLYKAGHLRNSKINEVEEAIIKIIRS